jgi:hypothetical protein
MMALTMCSYNSRGHSADRLAYMERLMDSCDLLLIQEHWFHQNDIHKLSRSEDYVVTGVSGMDSDGMRNFTQEDLLAVVLSCTNVTGTALCSPLTQSVSVCVRASYPSLVVYAY